MMISQRKYLLILIVLIFSAMQSIAQESGESKWGLKFSGFVKNDCWFDTRQVFTSREDLFLFYPQNAKLDADGADINQGVIYNFNAMTTRLTAKITSPDAMGAKLSGCIEGDFSGVTNDDINGFRLRHAYVKLRWPKIELMIGQYWHPIFTTEAVPNVASLNTGAPFQPFVRNPLISLTGIFGKFKILGAFITQRDNSSSGPIGYSPNYLRNAILPNVHLQFQFNSEHHSAGIGGDYKTIKPSLVNFNNLVTNTKLGSYAFLAYYKMNYGKLTMKLKGVYGQNLTEFLMLGGYAVKSLDSVSGDYSYVATNHLFSWFNLTYGKKWQGNIFLGYARNFGLGSVNTGLYYARGSDISYLYRIAPGISYVLPKLQFSLEGEYTVAAYGDSWDAYGKVLNAKEIGNFRLLFMTMLFF